MKKILGFTLFMLVMFTSPVFAANHYILDGGSGDGSAWNNALDSLPSTLVRGDTYYIGDGEYGAYTFDDNTSGSTYIYIKKATASDHGTETGWSSTYGDGQAVFTGGLIISRGYYEISGNSTTIGSYGFLVDSPTIINAIHFTATLSYVLLDSIDVTMKNNTYCISSGGGIKAIKGESSAASYVTIRNCRIANFGDAICTLGEYLTVEYCHFERLYPNNEVMTNDGVGYCGSASSDHGDSIVIGTNYGTVRYNVFDWAGQQVYFTGAFYNDGWKIYGNVFTSSVTNTGGSCGIKGDSSGPTVTNISVYNNTFVNLQYGIIIRGGDPPPLCNGDVRNNIFWDVGTSVVGCENTHDYNAYPANTMWYGDSGGIGFLEDDEHPEILTSSPFKTYSDDGNEENDDYSLSDAAAAAMASGDSTIGEEYQYDGIVATTYVSPPSFIRGQGDKWDRGAYEFTGAAAATGTVVVEGGIDEGEVRTGGKTIVITLTGTTWVAAGEAFDAQRAGIAAGVDSNKSEATGWDAVVKAGIDVDDVVRTNDTTVTITLDPEATYDITESETITVTIPYTAVVSATVIVGTPTFIVSVNTEPNKTGQVGTIVSGGQAATCVSGGHTLTKP